MHAVSPARASHVSTKYADLRCLIPLVLKEEEAPSYVAAGFLIFKMTGTVLLLLQRVSSS